MNIPQIVEGMEKLADTFDGFRQERGMPDWMFKRPDHLGIKCADGSDYVDTCNNLLADSDDGIWQISLDGRLLASMELFAPIDFSSWGIKRLEIMQPRPGKETEKGQVEHVEFTFEDLFTAQEWLRIHGIHYEEEFNPGHSWLSMMLDDDGLELKINDRGLDQIIPEQKARGELKRFTRYGN